jgi:hypothetical protein
MSRQATGLALAMAKALEEAARQRGWDYVKLADHFGVRPHYVRRVFNGDVAVSLDQLDRYAAAIGCEWRPELVTYWGPGRRS